MFTLRRVAFKALTVSPRTLVPQTRSIVTITSRETFQCRRQWIMPAFQRRFASSEESAKRSDVEATEETVANEAGTAAEASAAEPKDAAMSDLAASPDQGVVVEPVSKTEAETVFADRAEAPKQPRSFVNNETQNTLYIGNLFFEVSEAHLQKRFEEYGPIKKVTIIYDQRGLSKGFGYVEFEKAEDAQSAIQQADQDVFHGRRLAVQQHRPRERPSRARQSNDPSKTLFIGNMSYEMSDKDLNDLFRQIKGVIDVRVAIDRNTGQPRGFAHADFTDSAAATQAKSYLQDKEIYGRKLRVDYSLSSAGVRNT